jgi:GrpB-like predicted nucleotidyltransferase (UPF0157 family)
MVPYDPKWAPSYEEQARRLEVALQPWLVEPLQHIGSTAVPGLAAKPIIDIVAVVTDIDLAGEMTKRLSMVHWLATPEPTDAPLRKLSYCTPSIALRTHHLHVVERASSGWQGWIAFRDYLRANPQVAAEYGELKSRLAEAHGDDPNQRDAYRAGKAEWIAATTATALRLRPDFS